MPEQVVEQVRFGEVIKLFGRADPPRHGEAPVGEVAEEIEFRQQALHGDELPAGGVTQHVVEIGEIRDRVRGHVHRVLRAHELVTGAADQQFALPREQF